jgi:hypothetical protein
VNFDLQGKSREVYLCAYAIEELIEKKVKTITEELVRKSQNEQNQKVTQRIKQIKEYVDEKVGGPGDQGIVRRSSFSAVDQSGSFPADFFSRLPSGQHQISNEDYKTKALKRALQTEVSHAFLAHKLQCKPIEGFDIPLNELHK